MAGFMSILPMKITTSRQANGHPWRNATFLLRSALVLLALAALPACAEDNPEIPEAVDSKTETEVLARAESLKVVTSLHIPTEDCAVELNQALQNQGLRVAKSGEVDIILHFTLKPQAGWFSGFEFLDGFVKGFATRAVYEAQFYGKDEKRLLTLHGEKSSLTGREMCQDIGDDLADRLKRK